MLAYHITQLNLQNYRNYSFKQLDVSSPLVIIIGKNGSGKTNLLEAISLLAHGRGLRKSRFNEIKKDNKLHWQVSGNIQNDDEYIIGSALDTDNKRIAKLNGELLKNTTELTNWFNAIWLTPQMDGIFLDSSSERRRFFDRIIQNFDSNHAELLANYESVQRERIKLLKTGQHDDIWLTSLEKQLASFGIAIAAKRNRVIKLLQNSINDLTSSFPKAIIEVAGEYESALLEQTAIEVEQVLVNNLKQSRQADAITGKTNTGPHKTDFVVINGAKNRHAKSCSTGEQKALLVSIILALGKLIRQHKGVMPVMLLDELMVHFDATRRQELFDEINNLNAQCWITATDADIFDNIKSQAMFIEL